MAGNAIGLGNFIRFPAKAAAYGGGAYLIPYFIALFLLGISIMFVGWVLCYTLPPRKGSLQRLQLSMPS